MANEMNQFINEISKLHGNISVISHSNMVDHSGKLDVNLGRHNPDGSTISHDSVHLGSKGIALLCMNIKHSIIKMKSSPSNQNLSSQKVVQTQANYPYWVPNENYRPNMKAPTPINYPWTGDHNWNFEHQSSQSYLLNDYNDGFQL